MKSKIIKSILFSTIGTLSISAVTPMVLSSCGKKQTIPVQSIELDKKTLSLILGDSYKLTANVLPENATNKKVTWSSSDPSTATVDQNGNIKAVSEGTATITATTKDSKKTDTCEVTITKKIIHVTSVTLDEYKLKLNKGEVAKLTANILPENATNKNVTWSSLKQSVATVDQYGNVTAKSAGNVEIAVTTEDGWHTTTCLVVVTEKVIPVTGVKLGKGRLRMVEGETTQLIATIFPEDATNKNVAWTSSDESIATVDQNGNVKAKAIGNATVKVITEDGGYTSACLVTISEKIIPVANVTLDKDKLELVEGKNAQITANVLPENATNKNVTWESSNESIVVVDKNGKVTATNPGVATITVTTEDGSKTDTCEVTVKEYTPVEDVTLDKDRLDLIEGQIVQLIATVLPEDATYKNVTWRSKDESVATVDQNGNIKAVSEGTATITVTTEDGWYKSACLVTVTKKIIPVNSVTLDKNKLEMVEGDATQLIVTVLPENATNKNVTWSSSDSSIATVDQNGNVTAESAGNATITVTTEDGGYTYSCTVQVNPPVVVGMDYGTWGNIKVKYKLFSNHECRLLTKYNGEDSENGYVEGAGVLRIPDHVVWNGDNYYVRRIPSEWSDGENDINGIEFDNVSHLKEICDYAFKCTNALDNYHHKVCIFPEGLEYIGTEAFYNVDRGNGLVMRGLDFPSTLNAINVRAFANAGLIGDEGNPATIMFRGNFNTANLCNEAFSPRTGKNTVYYVYAPVMEIAANIANHIRVVYENDFETGENCLIPKVLGS